MSGATNCAHCGANLGPADLQRPACPYCGTVHPHVAAAAQKVEVLKQLLATGPGGVPPVFSGLAGPTPPTIGQPMGAPAWSGAVVVASGGALVPSGSSPPLTGGPVGGGTPYMVHPHGAPRAAQNTALVITLVVLSIFLVGGGVLAALLIFIL